MKIDVIAIRLIDPNTDHRAFQNGLRGFADVKLNAILIKDFRIFQRDERIHFLSPYTTFRREGKMNFNPIVTFPEDLRAEVNAAIVKAYFMAKENKHETQQQPTAK